MTSSSTDAPPALNEYGTLLAAGAAALPEACASGGSVTRLGAADTVLRAVLPLLADLLDPTGIPQTVTTRQVRQRVPALLPVDD